MENNAYICALNYSRIIGVVFITIIQLFTFGVSSLKWSPSSWTDNFERQMCRERLYRMDWEQVVGPCKDYMSFGRKTIWSSYRTDAIKSFIGFKTIRPAGEYSTLRIQSVDKKARRKNVGGDTWRVVLRGPSTIEPLVYDLKNGVYEVSFLIIEPGRYKVDVHLEGSLCSSFIDPPKDWFKKGDYNGHFQEDWMYKKMPDWPTMLRERLWVPLGGNETEIFIHVKEANRRILARNLRKLQHWHSICGLKTNCRFLWDGYGRWVKGRWQTFRNEKLQESVKRTLRKKHKRKNMLWVYGDCYAYHFYETIWNKTLCNRIYKNCSHSYNWIYPRLHPVHELDPSIHRKDEKDISIPKLIHYLSKVIDREEMDENSVLLLNFGLHFARATSFDNYRKLIKWVIKELQENYEGRVIWRTTTAVWKPEKKVHKRFQTYQRVMLFNAFAMEDMCKAGIPILDVFPMTASAPKQPPDGIHYDVSLMKPIEKILVIFGLK